jgi:hypothetical protein
MTATEGQKTPPLDRTVDHKSNHPPADGEFVYRWQDSCCGPDHGSWTFVNVTTGEVWGDHVPEDLIVSDLAGRGIW